jgi:LPS export ABC transporter protein LptC
MGIDQLPIFSASKKIKYFFSTIVIVLVSVIIAVFIHNRLRLNHIAPPRPPQKTAATLSIQNFRHTATQDGKRKWSIEATSANLYSKENIAELSDISAVFFLNNEKTIVLSADKGLLRVDTNNITVSGKIVVKFSDHVMETENLNYVHKSHIINATTPVTITGETMRLKADTMSYNLNTDIIKCSGNVTGTFHHAAEE